MEMSSNETIKQAVMAGMGLSFMSLHTIGLELQAGLLKLVHVEGAPMMRTWNVVHLMSRVLSPSAEAFRYFHSWRPARPTWPSTTGRGWVGRTDAAGGREHRTGNPSRWPACEKSASVTSCNR